jgi:hypothetical protein
MKAGRGGNRVPLDQAPYKFQKGKSGNPGGHPKGHRQEMAKMHAAAQAHWPDAIRILAEIMNDGKARLDFRILAADKLLDRAFGKANQPLSSADGSALFERVMVTFVRPEPITIDAERDIPGEAGVSVPPG